jgi:hypothetical protein
VKIPEGRVPQGRLEIVLVLVLVLENRKTGQSISTEGNKDWNINHQYN